MVMPGGVNGRQLADEAVRRRPGLKVLFTTGYTRNAIANGLGFAVALLVSSQRPRLLTSSAVWPKRTGVHHGRLDPGVQMIGKPFSRDELTRRVRAVLDGGA